MMRDVDFMTDAIATNPKTEMRRFWLRTLLAIGILWGFMPFVLTPFITKGPADSYFDIAASILNSLTILPACALAFWHRRIACVWLSVNAVIIGAALARFIHRTGKFETMMIVEVAGPILFALLLDVIEALRWPAALEKRKPKARQN